MIDIFQFTVPYGFVLTTNAYRNHIDNIHQLDDSMILIDDLQECELICNR